MTDPHSTLLGQCIALYGPDAGAQTHMLLQALISVHQTQPSHAPDLTERDAMLIAYGDHVREPNVPPLRTLGKVCETYLGDAVPCLHILPFYPYTSDDGFSVSDYRAVDPALGTWADVEQLARRLRLMFDAVINHASTQHAWFQGFLKGDLRYQDYFVTVQGNPDLTQVVRPRTLPLLTSFQTSADARQVWTTFSADQVDLNYGNPQVLLEIVDLLLFYAAQGAEFIRLDAIAYLWKEIGTACIHLPQTHRAIQLIRAALDAAAPHVKLITETNVPHVDNVAYFGDGTNEAQLVYNFALPPLTLHTLRSGDATLISEWASNLVLPTDQTTFFNFLASHDGIGLNPARGILSELQIDELVTAAQRAGGKVGYKNNGDGTHSPYELNINYFDALAVQGDDAESNDDSEDKSEDQSINRFIAAHAIMFSLIGMPGIYFHSLFGSRGWPEGVAQLGHNRAVNREKLNLAELEETLRDRHSRRSRVLSRLTQLLRVRGQHAAFDPYGSQRIVKGIPSTVVVQRIGRRSRQPVLCLINVTNQPTQVSLPWRDLLGTDKAADDLVSSGRCMLHGLSVSMEPYQIRWLTA